jgi:hypothetical protein
MKQKNKLELCFIKKQTKRVVISIVTLIFIIGCVFIYCKLKEN